MYVPINFHFYYFTLSNARRFSRQEESAGAQWVNVDLVTVINNDL